MSTGEAMSCWVCGCPEFDELEPGEPLCEEHFNDGVYHCKVCDGVVYEEVGHAYHEPSCAVIRGAWQTEQFSGHDYEIQELHCRCDGYVHDHHCSVCFVGALLAPVHKFLYDRENA